MNRHEIDYYHDISMQTQYLKRIAIALEKLVTQDALIASNENTSILTAKEILDADKIITDDIHPATGDVRHRDDEL